MKSQADKMLDMIQQGQVITSTSKVQDSPCSNLIDRTESEPCFNFPIQNL